MLAVTAFVMLPSAHAQEGLQQAVAAAAAGAVLSVAPGVHHVHLVLDRPVTLKGQPGAILDGDGQGDVVRIRTTGVTLRNLTIRNSGRDLTAMNAGVYVEKGVDGAVVENNRIQDILFGVYLDGPQHVQVIGNVITGITELRVPSRGDGIHLWSDANCVIRGNDVSAVRDGIYDYVSHDNLIADNHIHEVRYGVHQMYTRNETLQGNTSSNNVAGMALMSSDHMRVVGNHMVNDSSYGILFNYVTYSDIGGNEVRDITGDLGGDNQVVAGGEGKALFVYNSEFNRIHDNLLADSPIGIHITAGSQDNHVYNNAFVNNRTQVKYVQNVADEWSLDGKGNYWSNYLGWDLDGDGLGDVPYRPNDGVDMLLWKYPGARVLLSSPSILLLRYVQRAFPVFTPPSVQDSHPLMSIPEKLRARAHDPRH
ncbi:MAG: nitrous oxide reductase family maturation protein NosD [Rhodanobacter sp.]|nr:MAG: nitrous oxide reductase family maturation protein NosD [Rhodanobacter sp.]TAL98808.1 MAG: nitrous oxide reductase family maturation protein NosD [Rhodanobacter sp.]TAM39983.1 MAG: nitrous oxide reductase family maturation protein NosD [Rhodanobacter sp.]TAN23724.1 MAG: nitrous oxide reductase family maturation protein NosD [Rhodanobacter sp.]